MPAHLFRNNAFPYFLWVLPLVLGTYLFHLYFPESSNHRIIKHFGWLGTLLIGLSFAYSIRLKKWIQFSRPRKFLSFHEYSAWAGTWLILVHAGTAIRAWLPWVALVFMVITTLSGLVGKFLLKQAQANLRNRLELKKDPNWSPAQEEDYETQIFEEAKVAEYLARWRGWHKPLVLFFVLLSLTHIFTILFLWGWK